MVPSAFSIRSPHSLAVQVTGRYDTTRELVIDPTLVFSTYWGAGGANNRTVAIDPSGNIYMSGGTIESYWPTTLGRPHCGGSDVTVVKFDQNGKLLWSTLLGGPSEDSAHVSAVNDKGELYVSGRSGRGFPTTPGAFDRTFNGGKGGGPHEPGDAFVVKLSSTGEVIYSTYIGGNGDENGRAIHLLPSGKLIVGGGNSTSTDLPTNKGTIPGRVLKPQKGGNKDSWVAVVAQDGRNLDFLTYFGPNDDSQKRGDETIRALGVDAVGNIWIGGTTFGTDMTPTPNAFQRVRGSDSSTSEAYIAKLSPDGKKLVYFSWLGGNKNDEIETEGVSEKMGTFMLLELPHPAISPPQKERSSQRLKVEVRVHLMGTDGLPKLTTTELLGLPLCMVGQQWGLKVFLGLWWTQWAMSTVQVGLGLTTSLRQKMPSS